MVLPTLLHLILVDSFSKQGKHEDPCFAQSKGEVWLLQGPGNRIWN